MIRSQPCQPTAISDSIAGAPFADLPGLLLVLAGVDGIVLGVVVLVTVLGLFSDRRPARRRRGVVVPLVGVIVRGGGGGGVR